MPLSGISDTPGCGARAEWRCGDRQRWCGSPTSVAVGPDEALGGVACRRHAGVAGAGCWAVAAVAATIRPRTRARRQELGTHTDANELDGMTNG